MDLPRISVVTSGRNDNYGGDFLGRMGLFQHVLLSYAEEIHLPLELVVVEWNPPPDKIGLADAIRWTPNRQYTSVRILTVPNKLHASFPNTQNCPMLEYPAKNVGIRRAEAPMVLATNPDLIFSKDLLLAFRDMTFDDNVNYRIDRMDYHCSIAGWESLTPNECERRAMSAINKIHSMPHGMNVTSVHRTCYRLFRTWPNSCAYHGLVDHIRNPLHTIRKHCHLRARQCVDLPETIPVHHSNSGDFILASRSAWEGIRGFAECFDTFTGLDSLACYQFKALSLSQRLFVPPCMLLHLEHDRSQHEDRRSFAEYNEAVASLNAENSPCFFNSDQWGLLDHDIGDKRA